MPDPKYVFSALVPLLVIGIIMAIDPVSSEQSPPDHRLAYAHGANIGEFIAPDGIRRSWQAANSYCEGLGGALSSKEELQQLFVNTTSSPTWHPQPGYIANNEICTAYGWPLYGQCGGSSDNYWSSTPGGAQVHYIVDLYYGGAFRADDTDNYHIACVRNRPPRQ